MSATIEEILARDGVFVYKTRGTSMRPMLCQNRDLVTVRVPSSRLKKSDVALYRRGSDHVLHRVIKVRDGYYLIRGDNTFSLENVPDEAVIGVLTDFVRKGKKHSVNDFGYRFYVRLWNAIYPFRVLAVILRRFLRRILRKPGFDKANNDQ